VIFPLLRLIRFFSLFLLLFQILTRRVFRI
jgi:hypothetical protein